MNDQYKDLRSAIMNAIGDVWDRAKQVDEAADEVLDLIEADRQARGEPVAHVVEAAWREGWAACRDSEYVGREAEDDAYGDSRANFIAIDLEQGTAPKPQQQESEPTLEAPAQVGNVRFGKGIKWSTVIGAAQRHYVYMTTPQKEQERIQKAAEFVKRIQDGAEPQPQQIPDKWRKAVTELLDWAEMEICTHEETHRGGAIWEICNMCGAKWADDEGGKPEFVWPKEISNVRAMLEAAPEPKGEV